jgi:flagellar motor component MotA
MSYETDLLEEISKHKNWTRFDPSRLIGAAAFFTLVLVVFAMGGVGIGVLFNLPAAIICIGGMISLSMVAYGVDRQSHALGLTARVLLPIYVSSDMFGPADVRVFRGMIASLYASGAVGFMIGTIQLLARIYEPEAIGPAVAVALLCPFYALLGAEGLLRPMSFHLIDKLGK